MELLVGPTDCPPTGLRAGLDGIGGSAVVNDPYGKLWVRTLIGLDL